jgi:hypothetical protein
MYPTGELTRLAWHKAELRYRIANRRLECATAFAQVERPLRWFDRALDFWRRVSPVAKLAAIPLALLMRRRLFRNLGILGSLLRLAPIAFTAGKAVSAMRRPAQTSH